MDWASLGHFFQKAHHCVASKLHHVSGKEYGGHSRAVGVLEQRVRLAHMSVGIALQVKMEG